MRKTDKYFRTELRKGFDEGSAVIADVLKKHFTGKWGTEVKVKNEFNWNHCVEGFGLTSKGEVYVNVYWQGDNTDGNNTVCLNDFKYRNEVVIPAESFFDGYRTYKSIYAYIVFALVMQFFQESLIVNLSYVIQYAVAFILILKHKVSLVFENR